MCAYVLNLDTMRRDLSAAAIGAEFVWRSGYHCFEYSACNGDCCATGNLAPVMTGGRLNCSGNLLRYWPAHGLNIERAADYSRVLVYRDSCFHTAGLTRLN
jgi:hypothetical protein